MPSSPPKAEIEDLVDFFGQWAGLRGEAIKLKNDPRLDPDESTMLEWMILVIDRVGPADLDLLKGPNS